MRARQDEDEERLENRKIASLAPWHPWKALSVIEDNRFIAS